MTYQSPRLGLPYLAPAQSQKHVTVNEALRRLDSIVHLAAKDMAATTPPETPQTGDVYILDGSATGEWAGQVAGTIAIWADEVWQFLQPLDGWLVIDLATGAAHVWQGTAWTPLVIDLPPLNNLSSLGVGTSADTYNRLAVSSPSTLLTHAGGDHRLVLNKAGQSNTSSLLFQSGWSGRAEFGLAGQDNLTIKVSPDGGAWFVALSMLAANGYVGVGTYSPQRPLHVSDVMRLEPSAEPSNGAAGDIYFDAASARLRCHDGTSWHNLF